MEDNISERFYELYDRAYTRMTTEYTKFLDLEQQRILASTMLDCTLYGGYEGAERVVAAFGEAQDFPIVCLQIAPKGEKWADELTHRDFLGSLMGLGISRELVGDIVVSGKTAYVLCLESIARFIVSELSKVKRTAVTCRLLDRLPETAVVPPQERELVVSSPRLDAVIAAVWELSRSEAKELFARDCVFVNSRPEARPEREAADGDIISVRGRGRVRYRGLLRQTAKGRLRILTEVW